MKKRLSAFCEKIKALLMGLEPDSAKGVMTGLIAVIYLKFLVFDLIWAFDTTFSCFKFPIGYLTKLAFSTLLALPMLGFKSKWYAYPLCFLLDLWLIANIMYVRTYYNVIPLTSYGLINNLADFQESVWASLRWADILFPMTTVGLIVAWRRVKVRKLLVGVTRKMWIVLTSCILVPILVVAVDSWFKGGYRSAYEKLMYDYVTCTQSVYTIPGTWLYDALGAGRELTPEIEEEINNWLASRPVRPDSAVTSISARDNCIIILCESFESWLIGANVDGIEITPRLNAFLKEDSVFYAPNMLSQVRGARSIDAQLLIHTGLFPINSGAYSHRFPHTTYMSLDKAFKEKYPDAKSTSFTVDKKIVWNAAVVAQDFGIDQLVDKNCFNLDVATGPRKRLGDHSFFRQTYEKLLDDTYFANGGHSLIQCVTYSGHTPFIIPDSLKQIRIPDKYPETLRSYMEVANYTDRAIGEFVDRLRSNPKFANTMIVITGDHDGLGTNRSRFLSDPDVAKFMSPGYYTPFLVLNSPVEGRYDEVFGQIDFYPTMLDLLRLDDYEWRGMGQSLFDPARKPFAVSPQMQIDGDATSASSEEIDHYRKGYNIADKIISRDYFKNRHNN